MGTDEYKLTVNCYIEKEIEREGGGRERGREGERSW